VKKGTWLMIGGIIGLIIVAIAVKRVDVKSYFSSKPASTTSLQTKETKSQKDSAKSTATATHAQTKSQQEATTATDSTAGTETTSGTTPPSDPTPAAESATTTGTPAADTPGTLVTSSTSDFSATNEISTTESISTEPGPDEIFFFWSFNSRTHADGFKKDLEKKTGIVLLIEDISDDKYDVGFKYLNEVDRIEKIGKIEKAGGIKVRK